MRQQETSAAPGTEAKPYAVIGPASATKRRAPPPSLYAKIIAVAAAMEPLAKRDRNPDIGYSFVSIDDYYEKAASKLLEAGVSWICREKGFTDTGGLLWWQFHFDVFDAEGNVWKRAGRVTVPHEFEGPQTAGKVVSYAEKVFLRQLLKLVTGEPDADISRQPVVKRGSGSKASAAEVPVNLVGKSQGVASDYDELERFVLAAPNMDAMNLVIDVNKKMIARANANDPEVFAKLAKARDKKLKEFEHDV